MLQAQRQTLLQQLTRKFGPLSETIVAQIKETDRSTQLTEWLDRLIEIDNSDDIGFVRPTISP